MNFGQLATRFGTFECFYLLRSRWPVILLSTSLVLLGGAVVRKQVPRLYEASAMIDLGPESTERSDGAADPDFRPVWQNDLKRQATELGSHSILQEAAARVDLVRRWKADSPDEAIEQLSRRLRVDAESSGQSLVVSVRDLSREHAAALANAIGDRFVARKDSEVRAEANARVRRMQEERDEAASEIEATEARLVEMSQSGADEASCAEVRRDLVTLRHLHHSLEAKHQQALLEAEIATTPVRLSAPASPGQAFAVPQPWLSLPGLFLTGLVCGVLVVLGLEGWGGKRWNALADLMKRLDVPVAGFGPLANHSPVQIREFPDAWIEPYRELRNRLFRLPAGECLILTVMPLRRKDPVAEVVTCLATVFADAGRTTLVIDADFRSSALHDLFEAAQHPGLSDYLSGEMRLEETVVRARRANLWFMPAGPLPGDPGGLLHGRRMNDMLWDLRTRFDCILFASPSVHEVSDGGLLAGIADYTLVSTPGAGHAIKRLRETKTALETHSAVMGGVILTTRVVLPSDGHDADSSRSSSPGEPLLPVTEVN